MDREKQALRCGRHSQILRQARLSQRCRDRPKTRHCRHRLQQCLHARRLGISRRRLRIRDSANSASARCCPRARSAGFLHHHCLCRPRKESGFWGKKVPWLNCCQTRQRRGCDRHRARSAPQRAVIVKKFPSAFFETDLQDRLHARGIDTIVLAGCTTSVCVRATAVDSMQRNFHTLVAAEAVGDLDAALHAVHLRDLDARYADVMSVDDLLAYFRSLPLPSKTTKRNAIR